MVLETAGADNSPKLLPMRLSVSVREFLREVRRFVGRKIASTMFLMAFGAVLEGIGLILIIPLLGLVTDTRVGTNSYRTYARQAFAFAGVNTKLEQLAFVLGIFIVLIILRSIVISARDLRLAQLQIGFVEALRGRIMERLATAEWSLIARLRHARVTDLLSGDIQRMGSATHFLFQATVAFIMLTTQCVLAVTLSPTLALVAFALLALGAISLLSVMRRARDIGEYVSRANLELLSTTSQFLGGLKLAISQNLQVDFVEEVRDTLQNLTQRQILYIRQQTNVRLAIATLSSLVAAAAIFIGFGLLNIALPTMVVLLLILARMNGPVAQIQQGAQQLANSLPAFEKITVLDAELMQSQSHRSIRSNVQIDLWGSVVFRNVSYSHVEAATTEKNFGLENLNVTIRPGSFVGVIGPSGAGKSTFADLLVGLYPPQIGEIDVAGSPLSGEILDAWREQISYVSQDPFLFHDTIRKNLSWANPKASDEEMWNALAAADAENLVSRMELGLDTIVGERGTLISGGERQRIALARAVLRKPIFLLLDEATNAIDVASEQKILQRLKKLQARTTVVMIAHRRESLLACERILELDKGQLLPERTPLSVISVVTPTDQGDSIYAPKGTSTSPPGR